MGEPDEKQINPAHARLLRYFQYEHLPDHLAEISRPFCELARALSGQAFTQLEHIAAAACSDTKDPAEITVALRKLLEAKDAAVRAFV